MSLTGAAFLALVAAGLVLALAHPLLGLCTYLWIFYNPPNLRWWGEALPNLRWSLFAAGFTTASGVLHWALGSPCVLRDRHHSWSSGCTGMTLLVLFVGWMWACMPFALNQQLELEGNILFTKYLVLFALVWRLTRSQVRLEVFSWVHVAGCFLWGWQAFQAGGSGRFEGRLGPGVEDANTLGFHMVTGLAFAGFLLLGLKGARRWVALAAVPFILNTVILTASRGAVLGAAAGGLTALLFAPRSLRKTTWGAAVLGIVLFGLLAGSTVFWERMATLGDLDSPELEASAASRVVIARANWQMFLDHPLGTGHKSDQVLSLRYLAPEYLSGAGVRSSHNTVLALLVNFGFPGFSLFALVQIWAWVCLWRLRRLDTRGLPKELGAIRAAVASALSAYVVCGLFTNLIRAEAMVWFLGMTAALWDASEPFMGRSGGGSETAA